MAIRQRHFGSRGSSHGRKKTSSTLKVANICLLVLYAVLVSLSLWLMFSHNLLNFKGVNLILCALFIIVALIALLLIVYGKARKTTTVLLIVFNLFAGGTVYGFREAINLTNSLNSNSHYSEIEMSIVVPADSTISSIDELTEVAAATTSDSIFSGINDY